MSNRCFKHLTRREWAPQVKSLGFDVLAGVPPVEELARLLASKRGAIKSVLLDQVRATRSHVQWFTAGSSRSQMQLLLPC